MKKMWSLIIVFTLISCNNASKTSDDDGNNTNVTTQSKKETVYENLTVYEFPETGVSISFEGEYTFDETKNLLKIGDNIFVSVPTMIEKNFNEVKEGLKEFETEFYESNGVDMAMFSMPDKASTSLFAFIDNGENTISIVGGSVSGKEDIVKKILLSTRKK